MVPPCINDGFLPQSSPLGKGEIREGGRLRRFFSAARETSAGIGIQVTMKTIRSLAAGCATLLLAAVLLVQWGPLPAAAASATDEQIIAFLQKRFRLPSTRNITL